MIYLWSDLHLGHSKDFIWEARGYNSVEEMNIDLIKKINDRVSEEDTLYLLGDLMLGGTDFMEKGLNLLKQIKCKDVHFIIGNHDTNSRIGGYVVDCGFKCNGYAHMLKYQKYHFYLSHYPTLTDNNDYDKPLKARVINLCGHSHTTNCWQDYYAKNGLILHCEVDAFPDGPVSLDDIIDGIKSTLMGSLLPEAMKALIERDGLVAVTSPITREAVVG